ncbi:MAG: response regulator [Leptolyngbyaceae cyanobacterium bins.59]|nr:response regulator [Leptolyngbyaceae cyanobacterium bins.59]
MPYNSFTPRSSAPVSILIVDDQPGNLQTLSGILDREGFIVRQAISGQMALQTVQTYPPDLVLLDIRMPEMDGYEVCSRLKADQATCDIPIIFLSALDDSLDKTRALSIGGVDYITKPFQLEEVLIRIQQQLTIRSQYQQLLRLNQQLHDLNTNLKRQVQIHTLELQQALIFERTLKQISDQVRDTLDQHQILRTVVEVLLDTLGGQSCDAVLYDEDRQPSTMRYQSVQPDLPIAPEQVPPIPEVLEIYEQLHQKFSFAFCHLQPSIPSHPAAILVCPIFDDRVDLQGILGHLWISKAPLSSFSDQELHLVEQVANQCAVALRQARLYEAAQNQVRELERLNQLKDDFLSTISHELRTPLSNMKLVLQLLGTPTAEDQHALNPLQPSALKSQKAAQYFEILKQECDRELKLVQDLLDLQHVEAGVLPEERVTIQLQDWLAHLIECFRVRMEEQQQTLQLEIEQAVPPMTIQLTSLSRIVTELLNNACKYTPAHQTITVALYREARWICLEVRNTGVEIAPEEMSRIFDKFYRIPNNDPWKYGGTGLGLALVKKLVEQMGGMLGVASQENLTRFIVQLPSDFSGEY